MQVNALVPRAFFPQGHLPLLLIHMMASKSFFFSYLIAYPLKLYFNHGPVISYSELFVLYVLRHAVQSLNLSAAIKQ